MTTKTIEIPEAHVYAVAGILDTVASERLSKSGRRTLALRPKGDYRYKESFRETLLSVAKQLRGEIE
jgi:hypothetical protein